MRYSKFITLITLLFVGAIAFGQSAQQLFNEGKEFQATGKDRKAIKKYEDALEAAKSEKNIQIQMESHISLAELKDNVVNYKEALIHYKEFSNLYKIQTAQKAKKLE